MTQIIFISGIGTNVGKSYATGWLANKLRKEGKKVITFKMIQTGNDGLSEDIEVHRKVMGLPILPEDKDGTTNPIILSYPASPHLAAKIDKTSIDLSKIEAAEDRLFQTYDTILMEGAGGLMVPITEKYFTIDYISDRQLPVVLVTNGQLGSINHTLLSLEAIKSRHIRLPYIIYNTTFDEDKIIADETNRYLKNYVAQAFPETEYCVMDKI